MRIAFSGPGNSGKTTTVKSFLYTWDNYITPKKTYRDLIKEDNLKHSKDTTPSTQSAIIDFMVKVQEENKDTSHIIYDRCTLDNIAYTLWSHEKGVKGFTKQFCADQIAIMRDSMKHLDIIFLCSFDESQQIEDDGIRETDKAYIKEVDNIFNSLFSQYTNNVESDIFFPKDDTPCVLTVPSDAQKRIDLISEYVDEEGDMYGDEDSVLNSENLKELESLVYQQKTEADHENHMKDLHKKFGI